MPERRPRQAPDHTPSPPRGRDRDDPRADTPAGTDHGSLRAARAGPGTRLVIAVALMIVVLAIALWLIGG